MKKIASLLLAVVLTLGCVAGISFAAEPFAEVTNGTTVTQVATVDEMRTLINADGNTVIKLLKDYTYSGKDYFINAAYPVTLDLNGFTLKATEEGGGGVYTSKLGTKNGVTTVKNGTIITNVKNVRSDKGGLRLENVKGYTFASYNVSYADKTSDYNSDNVVTGCYLVAAKHFVLAYGTAQKNTADHSMVNVKIDNSTLIMAKTPGSAVFGRNSSVVIAGTFELGENVVMMTRNQQGKGPYFTSAVTLIGQEFTMTEKGTINMTFPELDNLKVEGMCRYETGAASSSTPTVEVSTEPVLEVTNGSTSTKIAYPTQALPMINKDGTTVIKLLKDYSFDDTAYLFDGVSSFTFDLDGHTLKGTGTGGIVSVTAAGTENGITTIKNGTIISAGKIARINKGGLRMENVTGYVYGAAYNISLADSDNKYNDGNLITGCYLVNAKHAVFAWGVNTKTAADHSALNIKIENSTLIMAKTPGSAIFSRNSDVIVPGTIELGKSVTLMTRNTQGKGYYFEGKAFVIGEATTKTGNANVDMSFPQIDLSVEGMTKWETAAGEFSAAAGPAVEKVADFADVAKDFWGYAAIMNAAQAGLVKGKSTNADGTANYVPNAAMTRAEFITVICRYFYPEEANAVAAGDTWWTGYYDLAIEKEFLMASELDGGELDKPMTREEMALVLSRTAPAQAAYASVTPAASSAIPDYASVDEYYQTAVLWAYGAGLLKGVDTAGTFNPKGELNRAAVATIFNTLLSSK